MFDKAYVTKDIEQMKLDDRNFPNIIELGFTSHGSDLCGVMLTPQGKGPHPTAILLHGFPGYDDPIDLAHALRQCGMNILRFHYRGSWGVKGSFSFSNCMEDVKSAIDFLTDEKSVKEFDIDTNNLFLIGHSMGGFLTLNYACDKRIKASVAISPYDFGLIGKIGNYNQKEKDEAFEMYKTALVPLNNTSAEILMQECLDNGDKWNLPDKAKSLSNEEILITIASRDVVSKRYLHHDILASEIKKYNNNLTEKFIDTDHSYSDKRILLAKTIAQFLEQQINKK